MTQISRLVAFLTVWHTTSCKHSLFVKHTQLGREDNQARYMYVPISQTCEMSSSSPRLNALPVLKVESDLHKSEPEHHVLFLAT